MLIVGDKGVGKGDFFAIPIAKLFGAYALENVTKIEDICGKFNSTIENKVLIVCNEMQSVENARYLNADSLKSIITENTVMYESKYLNSRRGENVSNFIFLSNHDLPIKIEDADRRYVCLKASPKYRQNFNYFGKLAHILDQPGFMQNLFTFFLHRDLSKFHPRMIPMTETKKEMIQASKDSFELFFEEYIDKFTGDGWVSKDCYAEYKKFCEDCGYTNPLSLKTFGLKIKKFVDIKQRKRFGEVLRYYYFNSLGLEKYNEIKRERESVEDEDGTTLIRIGEE